MMTVVGVDPGGAYSGIVTRRGDQLLAAAVITRKPRIEKIPGAAYVAEVLEEIKAHLLHAAIGNQGRPVVVAVEGINEPTAPFEGSGLRFINVAGLIGVAIVFGGILATYPDAVVVPPGGNGSGPNLAYPEAIRKHSRNGGPSGHARSAWDVAGAAPLLTRTRSTA